jgi:hypothetical protein
MCSAQGVVPVQRSIIDIYNLDVGGDHVACEAFKGEQNTQFWAFLFVLYLGLILLN